MGALQKGISSLEFVAEQGYASKVIQAIQRAAPDGIAALHPQQAFTAAARGGNEGALNAIFNATSVDVNAFSGKKGDTPLATAIRAKSAAAVRCLLHLGADPNLPTEYGTTPLFLIVRLVVGKVSDIELPS